MRASIRERNATTSSKPILQKILVPGLQNEPANKDITSQRHPSIQDTHIMPEEEPNMLLLYYPRNLLNQSVSDFKTKIEKKTQLKANQSVNHIEKTNDQMQMTFSQFTPFRTLMQSETEWKRKVSFNNTSLIDKLNIMNLKLQYNETQKEAFQHQMQNQCRVMVETSINQYNQKEQKFNNMGIKTRLNFFKSLHPLGGNKMDHGPDYASSKETTNNAGGVLNQSALKNTDNAAKTNKGAFFRQTNSPHKTQDDKAKEIEDEDEGIRQQISMHNEKRARSSKFFWYNITDDYQKPDSRENCTFNLVNGSLYLYGGVGRDLYNDMWAFNLEKFYWTKQNVQGDIPSTGRYGHSTVAYKRKLIIFGGEQKFNIQFKIRECFSDVLIFDTVTNVWSKARLTGDFIEPRRNHASAIVGQYMFIIGGIDNHNREIKDVSCINLDNFVINNLTLEDFQQFHELAFHSATPIFQSDIQLENPYFPYDHQKGKDQKVFQKVKDDGIYIFGGQYVSGEITNSLKIIKLGVRPLQWFQPEVLGEPPTPRCAHSSYYYPDLNIMIIYGGQYEAWQKLNKQGKQKQKKKNQSMGIISVIKNQDSFNSTYENGIRNIGLNNSQLQFANQAPTQPAEILSDIVILYFGETLQWMRVDIQGLKVGLDKCSFSSCLVDSQIFIFGGYGQNSYCNSDLFVLEVDQNQSRKFIRESTNGIGPMNQNRLSGIDIITSNKDHFFIESQYLVQEGKPDVNNRVQNHEEHLIDLERQKKPNYAYKKSILSYKPFPIVCSAVMEDQRAITPKDRQNMTKKQSIIIQEDANINNQPLASKQINQLNIAPRKSIAYQDDPNQSTPKEVYLNQETSNLNSKQLKEIENNKGQSRSSHILQLIAATNGY